MSKKGIDGMGVRALREACEAALRYDRAINQRAEDGTYEMNVGKAFAEGHDLDALYEDWITKARAALSSSPPVGVSAEPMGRYRVQGGRVVEWEIDNAADERPDGIYTLFVHSTEHSGESPQAPAGGDATWERAVRAMNETGQGEHGFTLRPDLALREALYAAAQGYREAVKKAPVAAGCELCWAVEKLIQ